MAGEGSLKGAVLEQWNDPRLRYHENMKVQLRSAATAAVPFYLEPGWRQRNPGRPSVQQNAQASQTRMMHICNRPVVLI
eukprot:1066688-Alexandrium_andersonii.AAC.1